MLDSDRNVRSTSFPVTVVGVLRSRVEAANAGDTVVLAAGTFFDNVTLSKDLTIEAEQTGATVIDGKGLGIPFTITNSATVHLRGLVIRNGRGGGVKNFGTLRLSDCLITANLEKSGPYNGGVVNFGALTMERCVVSGNSAVYGAGVHNLGTLSLSDAPFATMSPERVAAGFYNQPSGRLVSTAAPALQPRELRQRRRPLQRGRPRGFGTSRSVATSRSAKMMRATVVWAAAYSTSARPCLNPAPSPTITPPSRRADRQREDARVAQQHRGAERPGRRQPDD